MATKNLESDQNGDPTNYYRTVCPGFEFSTETLSLKPINKQEYL